MNSSLFVASSTFEQPGKLAEDLQLGNKQEAQTIVHRVQLKSRPSILSISFDNGVLEITPELSTTSAESSSNGKSSAKSSVPGLGESTGKTSLDSKFSLIFKVPSQHSSEKKQTKAPKAMIVEGCSNENLLLTSIAEVDCLDTPEPVPSKCLS